MLKPSPARLNWTMETEPVSYPDAISHMQLRVAAIRAGLEPEQIWLLEHPACYTAGTSANENDLTDPDLFPVFETGRGGQYTYHGPGQRIAYAMLDLQKRGIDIREYVCMLERWIIATLKQFDINGECRDGRIGVWVSYDGREDKIAALGVRVSRGVAYHGISINNNPNLDHFRGIVPCGIKEYGVTSLTQLGRNVSMAELDRALQQQFYPIFGAE
ncbi:MAG: lipoyl(octanoyl) transferase LipB [Alphaproteobacteria bacterium]|nr:MAG: lipoyl(octanoyl) transferase LipB [Alphaproteobacteria bacterium]